MVHERKMGKLTDKERKIMDAEYEKHKYDDMCPHTTNPLQLKRLCKRCRLLDQKNISVYQMPQGDWGCSVGDPDYSGAIVGFGIMSDGFKTRKDAEEWALNKGAKRECEDWRNLQDAILFRYAELCRQEENRQAREMDRNYFANRAGHY